MRMLIYIVGVVVIERACVIGARRFSAICFGATERVYNALLTLGAHAHSEGYSSCRTIVCVCVCVCVYVCVCDHS